MLKAITISILAHCGLFLSVLPGVGQDSYEDDDAYGAANVFVLGSETAQNQAVQHHTFHSADDADWVVFYALAGNGYAIRTFNIVYDIPAQKFSDTYIELYDTDGTTRLDSANFEGDPGHEDILYWTCDKAGVYYVKIKRAPGSFFVNEAGYDLVLFYTDLFYLPAYLSGSVKSGSGQPIAHARIKASGSAMTGTGLSTTDGSFVLSLASGIYSIFVSADGFQSQSRSGVAVPASSLHIQLTPLNAAPVAKPDSFIVARGGTSSGNVLLNDTDGDGDPLQAVLDENVVHGTLSLNSNGSFNYQHDGDDSLSDAFTYHAHDGTAASGVVTVTINIDTTMNAVTPLIMLLLH